jgi:hypothetical protein
MGLGLTHREVRRIVRGAVLQTHNARSIVRKAGVRQLIVDSGSAAQDIIIRLAYWIPTGGSSDTFTGAPEDWKQIPYNSPELVEADGVTYLFASGAQSRRVIIQQGGFYRFRATTFVTWRKTNMEDFPMTSRFRVTARDSLDVLVREALLQESYYAAEPQTGTIGRNSVTGFHHGEAVIEAEAGTTLGSELWVEFEGNSGPPGTDLTDAFGFSASFENNHLWVEYLGSGS